MKTFFFLSGLPRSGSTVLASLLNQNPNIFVTPTSPLLDQLIENQNIWHSLPAVQSNPNPVQLENITRAIMEAMWQHVPENIIIDKNRGWCKNLPAIKKIFNHEFKTIITTRDLPSIMASWLVLLRNNPDSYMSKILKNKNIPVNDETMMEEMWTNMVKDCFEGVNQAFKDAAKDQLLVLEYDDIVSNPDEIISKVTEFLCLQTFKYDYNRIISKTNDDDLAAWGLDGMHKIRPVLEKTSKDPLEILGKNLFTRFTKLEKHFRRN